jgi:hypothetical protein
MWHNWQMSLHPATSKVTHSNSNRNRQQLLLKPWIDQKPSSQDIDKQSAPYKAAVSQYISMYEAATLQWLYNDMKQYNVTCPRLHS